MKRGRIALMLAAPALVAMVVVLLVVRLSAPPPRAPPSRPSQAVELPPPPATLPIRLAPQDPSAVPDAAPGTFEGHVLSAATSAPISGADLTFSRGAAADSVRSQPDGGFLFRPPTPGRWLLAAVAAQGFFPFAPEWGFSPVQLEAAPGRHVRGLDVFLTPAAELVGLVVDEDGQPVAGAEVQLLGAGGRAALIPIASRFVSGGDGTFRAAAPQGSVLEARKPGYQPGHAKVDLMATLDGRVRIILAPGSSGATSTGAVLAGRVVTRAGQPLTGVLVEVAKTHGWAYSGSQVAQAVTDADGRFRFADLERSPHQLTARFDGYMPGVVSRVLPGGREVRITMQPGGRLRGCVRDERTGAPVAPFTVKVYFSRANFRGAPDLMVSVANPSGCFGIDEMEPGPAMVVVQAPGRAPSYLQEVDVPEPPAAAELNTSLSAGATVTGVVRDELSGAPLAGAIVSAEALRIDVPEFTLPTSLVGEAVTGGDGTFTMSGLPDGVRLVANAAGHNLSSSGYVATSPGAVTGPVTIALRPQQAGDVGPVEPVGIGAALAMAGDELVVDAVRGPGVEGGLRAGDRIVEIDGHAAADLGLGGAVEAMRGAEGTSVFLEVQRGGQTLQVEVPRRRQR